MPAGERVRREPQSALSALASSVDQGYPDNSDLSIDEDGRLTLAAVKGVQRSASEREFQAAIRERLPERSLLDILIRTTAGCAGIGISGRCRVRTRNWLIRWRVLTSTCWFTASYAEFPVEH